MADKNQSGHRRRIRDRFIAGDGNAHSDESLLELLLTYSIPQKDVKPLAKELIHQFGSLSAILEADAETLCAVKGIKENTAALLKVVDWIRHQKSIAAARSDVSAETTADTTPSSQAALFEASEATSVAPAQTVAQPVRARHKTVPRHGTELFSNAIFEESVAILPRLPDTDSLDDLITFLHQNLPFSSELTRKRYTSYIPRRVFPAGAIDSAIRIFARTFAGRQEIKDVVLYRFYRGEPLMYSVIEDLVLPAMAVGFIDRARLREYLMERFPGRGVNDCAKAIVQVFRESGIGQADIKRITFGYRDILIPSFAFILHSEFPEPGMHEIARLETNRAIRAMLWKSERLLPSLYELRNRGLIAKVSEIDTVRQFTTQLSLDQVAQALAKGAA